MTASTTATQLQIGGTNDPMVSVVIPVYNEASNIDLLTDEIESVLSWWYLDAEVIWVDDGSTDDSGEFIDTNAAMYNHHRAVHLRSNRGQSAALAAGFDNATGEIVVPMDGDGQNDPEDIPRVVEQLIDGSYDCVSGVRSERNDPLAKRIPSRIQTELTRRMAPDAGSDMGCTLKAYRADALENVQLRGEHHRYIPAQLASRGYRLDEIEVNHRERAHGNTKYGVGRLLRGFLDGVYHLLMTRYGARPIHLFGSIGLLLLVVGGLLGSHMLIERLVFQNPISQHMPRLLAIVGMVVMGTLMFMLGVMAELLTRLRYQSERPYRIDRVVE